MEYETFEKGSTVFLMDTYGDQFYIILKGKVDVLAQIGKKSETGVIQLDINHEYLEFPQLTKVQTIVSGESFGELALIYKMPRAATIVASQDCHFAVLNQQYFDKILGEYERQKIQEQIKNLKKIWLFSDLSSNLLKDIYINTIQMDTRQNQVIFREGDQSDACFLIIQGDYSVIKSLAAKNKQVEEVKQHPYPPPDVNPLLHSSVQKTQNRSIRIYVLSTPDVFGEEDILVNQRRSFTVICESIKGEILMLQKKFLIERLMTLKYINSNVRKRLESKTIVFQNRMESVENSMKDFQPFVFEDRELLTYNRRMEKLKEGKLKQKIEDDQYFGKNSDPQMIRKSSISNAEVLRLPFFKLSHSPDISPQSSEYSLLPVISQSPVQKLQFSLNSSPRKLYSNSQIDHSSSTLGINISGNGNGEVLRLNNKQTVQGSLQTNKTIVSMEGEQKQEDELFYYHDSSKVNLHSIESIQRLRTNRSGSLGPDSSTVNLNTERTRVLTKNSDNLYLPDSNSNSILDLKRSLKRYTHDTGSSRETVKTQNLPFQINQSTNTQETLSRYSENEKHIQQLSKQGTMNYLNDLKRGNHILILHESKDESTFETTGHQHQRTLDRDETIRQEIHPYPTISTEEQNHQQLSKEEKMILIKKRINYKPKQKVNPLGYRISSRSPSIFEDGNEYSVSSLAQQINMIEDKIEVMNPDGRNDNVFALSQEELQKMRIRKQKYPNYLYSWKNAQMEQNQQRFAPPDFGISSINTDQNNFSINEDFNFDDDDFDYAPSIKNSKDDEKTLFLNQQTHLKEMLRRHYAQHGQSSAGPNSKAQSRFSYDHSEDINPKLSSRLQEDSINGYSVPVSPMIEKQNSIIIGKPSFKINFTREDRIKSTKLPQVIQGFAFLGYENSLSSRKNTQNKDMSLENLAQRSQSFRNNQL